MPLPFTIPVTANLGIDYIKAGAAGKVFQVLWSQSKSSSSPRAESSNRQEYVPVTSNLQSDTIPSAQRQGDHKAEGSSNRRGNWMGNSKTESDRPQSPDMDSD